MRLPKAVKWLLLVMLVVVLLLSVLIYILPQVIERHSGELQKIVGVRVEKAHVSWSGVGELAVSDFVLVPLEGDWRAEGRRAKFSFTLGDLLLRRARAIEAEGVRVAIKLPEPKKVEAKTATRSEAKLSEQQISESTASDSPWDFTFPDLPATRIALRDCTLSLSRGGVTEDIKVEGSLEKGGGSLQLALEIRQLDETWKLTGPVDTKLGSRYELRNSHDIALFSAAVPSADRLDLSVVLNADDVPKFVNNLISTGGKTLPWRSVSASLSLESQDNYRLRLHGSAALQLPPGDLEAVTLTGDMMLHSRRGLVSGEVDVSLSSKKYPTPSFVLSGEVSFGDDGPKGTIALRPLVFSEAKPLSAQVSASWNQAFDLNGGEFSASAKIGSAAGELEVSGEAIVTNFSGTFHKTKFKGLSTKLFWSYKQFFKMDKPAIVSISEIEVPIRFTDSTINLQLMHTGKIETSKLRVASALSHAMGAQLKLGEMDVALRPVRASGMLTITGLELEKVLEEYPQEKIAGTGTIDGTLPFRVTSDGVYIDDGELAARLPGSLRYLDGAAFDSQRPELKMAFKFLEDLQYDVLKAGVNYTPDGTLKLAVKIHGSNPAWERGRPVDFSINLEENVPALLRSIQLARGTDEELRRAAQEQIEKEKKR